MSLPPQVSSAPPVASPAEASPAQAPAEPAVSAAPIWLQRVSLFVLVLFCVQVGGLMTILPWWPRFWDHNRWFQSHLALDAALHNGAVRGFISGLGLLDIWIGVSEAVNYRDHRP